MNNLVASGLAILATTLALQGPMKIQACAQGRLKPRKAPVSITTRVDQSQSLSRAQLAKIDNLLSGLFQITKQASAAEKLDPRIKDSTLAKIRQRRAQIENQLLACGSGAVAPLVESLDTWNDEAGHVYARALSKFGPQIVGPLIVGVSNKTVDSRERACLLVYGAKAVAASGGGANPILIEYLTSSSPQRRMATLQLIHEIRAGDNGSTFSFVLSGQLVSEVCKALKDENDFVRRAASETLGLVGPRSPFVAQSLCDAARRDPDAGVRRSCARALGDIVSRQNEDAAYKTLETLSFVLQNDEFDGAREAAAEAIGKMRNAPRPAVSALIAGLKDPVKAVQEKSIGSLRNCGELGASPDAVLEIIKSMKDLSNRDINFYCEILTAFHSRALPALPILISAINANRDQYGETSYSFAGFCKALGPAASPAVPLLIDLLAKQRSVLLNYNRGDTQTAILEALIAIGPEAKQPLVELSQRSSVPLRGRCEWAIKQIVNNTPLTPTLQVDDSTLPYLDSYLILCEAEVSSAAGTHEATQDEALVDELFTAVSMETRIQNVASDQDSRELALSQNRRRIAGIENKLLKLGPTAIPLLVESTTSSDRFFSEACAQTLIKFGPQIVRPIIFAGSTAGTLRGNRSLEYAYGAIGALGGSAVGPLNLLLNEKSPPLQISALSALRRLGRDSNFVIDPILINSARAAAESANSQVRSAAVLALGEIGPRNTPLLETLYSHLRTDASAAVRRSCAIALGTLIEKQSTDAAAKTIESLGAALVQDEFPGTRIAAANALRHGHNAPRAAVNALTQGITDPVRRVQLSCIQALSDFGGQSASALPVIIQQTHLGQDTEESQGFVVLLDSIGPAAVIALPALIANFQLGSEEGSDQAHYQFASFCKKLGPESAPAVPILIRMLNNKYDRVHAIEALGAIGPPAVAAISSLEHLSKNDPDVAMRCRAAIDSIRGKTKPISEERNGQIGGI